MFGSVVMQLWAYIYRKMSLRIRALTSMKFVYWRQRRFVHTDASDFSTDAASIFQLLHIFL